MQFSNMASVELWNKYFIEGVLCEGEYFSLWLQGKWSGACMISICFLVLQQAGLETT